MESDKEAVYGIVEVPVFQKDVSTHHIDVRLVADGQSLGLVKIVYRFRFTPHLRESESQILIGFNKISRVGTLVFQRFAVLLFGFIKPVHVEIGIAKEHVSRGFFGADVDETLVIDARFVEIAETV